MSLSSGWSSMRRVLPLVLGALALAMIWGRYDMDGRRQDQAAPLSSIDVWGAQQVNPTPVELAAFHHHHQVGHMGTARGFLSALIALFGMATWVAAVGLVVHQRYQERQDGTQEVRTLGRGLSVLVSALFVVTAALFLCGLTVG